MKDMGKGLCAIAPVGFSPEMVFGMVTNCHQLKLIAQDGKPRLTDVADAEQLFRIIQSIPSPKAEPFKQWLARVALYWG